MFNFNVFTTAMLDTELTDAEFRLLCLILNNISLSGTNETKMHNGFIMEKMEKGERQVRNLVNGLVTKNYITREVLGTEENHKANAYRLVETERQKISVTNEEMKGEKNCRNAAEKNCPLNNINDISMINNDNNINDSISDREININDENINAGDNPNDSINDRVTNPNDYFTEVKEWLNAKLDEYYICKTPSTEKPLNAEITNFIDRVTTNGMTPNQAETFQTLKRRFDGLTRQKQKYFSRWTRQRATNNDSISDISMISQSSDKNINDSINDNPNPQTPTSDMTNESANKAYKKAKLKEFEDWYFETLPNFIDGDVFDREGREKSIAQKLENEFGKQWWFATDHKVIDTATAIEDTLKKAVDHFANVAWPNALKERDANTPSNDNVQQVGNVDDISSTAPDTMHPANDVTEEVYYEDGTIVELPF